MKSEETSLSAEGMMLLLLVVLNGVALTNGLVHGDGHYKLLYVTFPLLLLILADFVLQKKKRS